MKHLDLKRKPKVLVLSDLHGWMDLDLGFSDGVIRLDSRTLAEIKGGEHVHRDFLNGGIDRAVGHLVDYEVDTLIGLSIGGTIAWKAVLEGMKCRSLLCLSATRLRYETQKPACEIKLFYGSEEPFRPKNDWFTGLGLSFKEVQNMDHEFYKNHEIIKSCELLY